MAIPEDTEECEYCVVLGLKYVHAVLKNDPDDLGSGSVGNKTVESISLHDDPQWTHDYPDVRLVRDACGGRVMCKTTSTHCEIINL